MRGSGFSRNFRGDAAAPATVRRTGVTSVTDLCDVRRYGNLARWGNMANAVGDVTGPIVNCWKALGGRGRGREFWREKFERNENRARGCLEGFLSALAFAFLRGLPVPIFKVLSR